MPTPSVRVRRRMASNIAARRVNNPIAVAKPKLPSAGATTRNAPGPLNHIRRLSLTLGVLATPASAVPFLTLDIS